MLTQREGTRDGQLRRTHRGPAKREPIAEEREVLALIAEQVAIPVDQLAGFLGTYVEDALRVVEDFKSAQWVESKRLVVGDHPWVWLRQSGAEASGSGYAAKAPTVGNLVHLRAINEVRLELCGRNPKGRWISERGVWRERRQGEGFLPDAVFEVNGERHAIEVELTPKPVERVREIMEEHCVWYEAVVYFCSPAVRRLLERAPWVAHNPKLVVRSVEVDERYLQESRWRLSGDGRPEKTEDLEPWELRVLELLAEQSAMPLDQFARFLDSDVEAAERLAYHFTELGLLKRSRPLEDEPEWVWLTHRGARLSGTELKAPAPTIGTLSLLRSGNEVRLLLMQRAPKARWVGRRMLGRGKGPGCSLPYAVVEVDGERHAVELVPAPKVEEQVTSLFERRSKEYDAVVCFAASRAHGVLRRALQAAVWPKVVLRRIPGTEPGRSPRAKRKRIPLVMEPMSSDEIPEEALAAIAEAVMPASMPTLVSAERKVSIGPRRYHVVTDNGRWCVTYSKWGWNAVEMAGGWDR